jgi:hypothetical protein
MFRYDIQQYMLRRNAHEGFRARNVIVRIFEVVQLSLGVSDPVPRLREIGLRVDAMGIGYHISRFPMVLLMPRETFEKNLRIEGCEVQMTAAFEDQNSGPIQDMQSRWWNFFAFPQTPDGERLASICQLVIPYGPQHLQDSALMQRFGPPHFPDRPIGITDPLIRFENPGPKQSTCMPYRPLCNVSITPPGFDRTGK